MLWHGSIFTLGSRGNLKHLDGKCKDGDEDHKINLKALEVDFVKRTISLMCLCVCVSKDRHIRGGDGDGKIIQS